MHFPPIFQLGPFPPALFGALFGLVLVLPAASELRAGEAEITELLPASIRFAAAETAADARQVPDFQRHVVPLLGRLGCNGRACHGSFQGRGGFRLSLFGYDFKMDHAALTGAAFSEEGLRVSRDAAAESLILRKPTLATDHEGGQRFEPGSWEQQLLQAWIEAGASGVTAPRELERLAIEPAEILFSAALSPLQLRVVAHWRDGHREDVTDLCRFRSNDDSVVAVDAGGRLESLGPGDTHVIVFYDNGVASVPVIRPVSERVGSAYPSQAVATTVDRHVLGKLRKLGVIPAELCSDAEFLRRVSIDLTGTLPSPSEIEQLLADTSPAKRLQKIDELLERPAYAAWWANKLCDFTGCNPGQQAELGQESAVQWYMWIYSRLLENTPYDRLVERIVLATGRSAGQSYDDYAAEMTSYYRDPSQAEFSQRETMPHYWTRRSLQEPADKALAFAHSFLGIRLQCAQCHKHPFAPWTQEDFNQFGEFFASVQYGVAADSDQRYRELAERVGLKLRGKDGAPIRNDVLNREDASPLPWRELHVVERAESESLSLLRSRIVSLASQDDPRESIMRWMQEPDNPWFARAFVNRVWSSYFSTGIIEPPDDLSPANPPSNPELLDWLATAFVDQGYDMKWLHREIVSSDAYQRSWRPNATNRSDRNFSRAIPRRIPAEIVYDGLKQAVAGTDRLDEVRSDLSRRAIGHLSMRLAGTYAMHVFGKPERALNCDCERVNLPTLLQAVFLQNDPLVDQRLAESGWLREVEQRERSGQQIDRSELIRLAWLRTVGRPPTGEESQRADQHLVSAESLGEGLRDLLWALVNTKEFVLNR